MKNTPTTYILAALYHESGRTSVAAGDTLAHTAGQARPFAEFNYIRDDAREGRLLTAANLERRIRIDGFAARDPDSYGPIEEHAKINDKLARVIHEAEREAIELGWTVVKLEPPRPWIPFDDLPEAAQAGRRRQAAYFLSRFEIAFLG